MPDNYYAAKSPNLIPHLMKPNQTTPCGARLSLFLVTKQDPPLQCRDRVLLLNSYYLFILRTLASYWITCISNTSHQRPPFMRHILLISYLQYTSRFAQQRRFLVDNVYILILIPICGTHFQIIFNLQGR